MGSPRPACDTDRKLFHPTIRYVDPLTTRREIWPLRSAEFDGAGDHRPGIYVCGPAGWSRATGIERAGTNSTRSSPRSGGRILAYRNVCLRSARQQLTVRHLLLVLAVLNGNDARGDL